MDWNDPALVLIPVLWLLGSFATAMFIVWVDVEGFQRRDLFWLAVWPVFWVIILGIGLREYFHHLRRNKNEEDYYAGD